MEDKDLTTHSANSEVAQQYKEEKQGDAIAKAKREQRNTMPYITASSCVPIGAVVPTKLSYETFEALNKFAINGTDTTEFVREKLGYNSRIAVCDAFASEQVDALALAIVQAESQKGFILGDMAGIGKGRVVAGMLRYAKKSGKIPVFVTIGSSLFTDIYRDFGDIGGFGEKAMPIPLIMNNDKDATVKKRQGNEMVDLFVPMKREEMKKIMDKGVMPKGADVVLMTYSQLGADIEKSNSRNAFAISKYKFLEGLSPNMFFVLDESHCASGDGNSAQNLTTLITNCGGVLFSSATYSKEPKSMMLYIPKTDIRDSNIRPNTIIEAVRENGEAVQEYIASMLVKGGQMIRRERSFEKCKIDYNYIKTDVEKYYGLYDKIMELYNEIEKFSKSNKYKNAVDSAKVRFAKEEDIEIVPSNDTMPDESSDEYKEWKKRNFNKFYLTFDPTSRVKNRFNWIENLFFGIKADYVAREVVRALTELNDEMGKPIMTEYRIGDKVEMINTNFKPIIAVRNTAETSLKDLGYKVGQKVKKEDNDYAKTLINIARSLSVSKLTLKPVNTAKKTIIVEEANILNQDFEDNGVEYNSIVSKMTLASSGIPLSPIDYMIDKIENTPRPNWDKKYTQSETYRVEEVTKRSLSLRETEELKKLKSLLVTAKDKGDTKKAEQILSEISALENSGNTFELITPKGDSVANKVNRFNTGQSDVIIINVAGSTGLSLHSKIDFTDRRPRVMMIHQVELDVYKEVQKRGRIMRTGQVNNPAYTYVVSAIPSEVRKLLMLRRKLRSLDANTSGNVKQSAKASAILDKEGNEIEDMTNKYGYQVLQDYVQMPKKEKFRDLVEVSWYNSKATPEDKFDAYLREIEKLACKDQEEFYNEMNALYSALKKSLDENDEWDLETSVEDLKASTENKKILYEGNDKNEFTKSVFIEDKFVTPKGKPYTKDELLARMDFLAEKKDYTEYHNDLTDEFEEYMEFKLKELRESYGQPDTSEAKTDEEKEEIIEDFNTMVEEAVNKAEQKFNEVKYPLRHFKPDKIVIVPVEIDALREGAFDEKGDRIRVMAKVGKFVGYKLNKKSDNKWSPMNIELEFATTSKLRPHLRITLTKQYRGIIDWIMDIKAHEISALEVKEAKDWVIRKTTEREKMRIITGELFRGFEMAQKLIGEDINYQKKKRLIKYSNSAGGVETGIKMFLQQWKGLKESASPTFIPINADGYKSMLKDLRSGLKLWWSSNNEFIEKNGSRYRIFFCTGYDFIRGGKERQKPQKEYISEYKESVLQTIEKSINVPYKDTRITLEMYSKGANEWVNSMKFFYFELSEDKFFELMDIMYRDFKVLENLKDASKQFIVESLIDPLAQGGEGGSTEKEGVYDYYLMTSFDEGSVPPNYIPNSFKKVPDTEYGMFSLRFPLSVIEGGIFKVVPANITEAQAIKNVLNSIQEDKVRLDYIKKVKEMKDDYVGIATMTQETIGVNPVYAVGLVSLKYAGKIIANNIDKPLPTDEAEDKTDIVEVEVEAIELKPIGWDSVQDFMIKFKSL